MNPVEPLTREEYLAVDAAAPEGKRWEYHDGGILALVGASRAHIQLTGNITTSLNQRLRPGGCHVGPSLQRVRSGADYLYPDVVAFCGEGAYTDEWPPSLLNPQFVAEVVAPETIERDRGWKLEAYKSLSSMEEIWLAWPTEVRIEQHVRMGKEWQGRTLTEGTAKSQAFGVEIPLEELYRLVP